MPVVDGAKWLEENTREPSVEGSSISILLKGAPGSGKTTAALSFPQPIWVIQADGNRDTLKRAKDAGLDVRETIIEEWAQFEGIVVPMIDNRTLPFKNPDGTKWEPRTIIIDTYSSIADLLQKELEGPTGKQLTQPDWGKILRRQQNIMPRMIFASHPWKQSGAPDFHPGYHVVFCSHLRTDESEAGGIVGITSRLPGSFRNHWEKDFDYAVLCESTTENKVVNGKVESRRVFKIHASPPKYHTCKGGVLPPEMEIPEGKGTFEVMNQYWGLK